MEIRIFHYTSAQSHSWDSRCCNLLSTHNQSGISKASCLNLSAWYVGTKFKLFSMTQSSSEPTGFPFPRFIIYSFFFIYNKLSPFKTFPILWHTRKVSHIFPQLFFESFPDLLYQLQADAFHYDLAAARPNLCYITQYFELYLFTFPNFLSH